MRWPALPKRIMGAGGPITVRMIKRVKGNGGIDCWGTWQPSTRTIRLERGCPPAYKWKTLYHELGHAVLDDAGLCHLLSDEGQEALVDAIATSRMAELRDSLGS